MLEIARQDRLMRKMERLQARLQAAQFGGRLNKAAKIQGRIQKLQLKLTRVSARATGTQLGIGIGFQRVTAGAGITGIGTKIYSVQLQRGAIKYQAPSGKIVTLGYTPQKAKKMYKTRRRRKRLTERDKAILAAIQANPQAAPALALFK